MSHKFHHELLEDPEKKVDVSHTPTADQKPDISMDILPRVD